MTTPTPSPFQPMSLLGWQFDSATNVISLAFTKGVPTECYDDTTMTKAFVIRLQGIEPPVELLPNEGFTDALARIASDTEAPPPMGDL